MYFQESLTLTGREHFVPRLKNQKFARYVVCAETIIAIWFFILDYILKNVMKKNNKMKIFKNCKKHRTGGIFWSLSSKTKPMKTCLENQSLALIILNSHKNQKNLTNRFWEKLWTERRTGWQSWFYRTFVLRMVPKKWISAKRNITFQWNKKTIK